MKRSEVLFAMFRKWKSHEEKEYLLAYLLKGSIASLINYINTHPKGKDAGRRDIVEMKYILSKCTPVIRNIIFKMFKEFDDFFVDYDITWDASDRRWIEYSAFDHSTQFKFRAYRDSKDALIFLSDYTKISDSIHDHQMFIYAAIGSIFIKKNIKRFEEEQKQFKIKNKVIEAYT